MLCTGSMLPMMIHTSFPLISSSLPSTVYSCSCVSAVCVIGSQASNADHFSALVPGPSPSTLVNAYARSTVAAKRKHCTAASATAMREVSPSSVSPGATVTACRVPLVACSSVLRSYEVYGPSVSRPGRRICVRCARWQSTTATYGVGQARRLQRLFALALPLEHAKRVAVWCRVEMNAPTIVVHTHAQYDVGKRALSLDAGTAEEHESAHGCRVTGSHEVAHAHIVCLLRAVVVPPSRGWEGGGAGAAHHCVDAGDERWQGAGIAAVALDDLDVGALQRWRAGGAASEGAYAVPALMVGADVVRLRLPRIPQ